MTSEARHGFWCGARTYPTTCRYCGQKVFYFSCDCGSRVFFDALGRPWPQHYCAQYAATLLSTEMLRRAVAHLRQRTDKMDLLTIVEGEYATRILARATSPVVSYRTVRQEPQAGEEVYDCGYLREICPEADVFRKFGIHAGSVIGVQMLGPLAQRSHSQITLVTGDLTREDCRSYTCLVSDRELQASGAKRGDLVWFSLRGWGLPGCKAVWLCDSLELPS